MDIFSILFGLKFQFLKNVANEVAEQVVDVILGMPETDNPRFYDDVIDIVLNVEASFSTRLKGKILEYIQGKYPFLNPRFDEILRYWESSGQTEAALELAKELIAFQPDPQARDKQARRKVDQEALTTLLEPLPRFDEWAYQEILEKGVRPLSQREPYRVARILIDATETMIRLTFHQDELEEVGSKDYSISWCKRVDETNRHYQDARENLVLTLTFACERVYEKAPESVAVLDQVLCKQRWDIFTRIRQHLYALHLTEQTKPWIREMILTHKDCAKWPHHFEFQRMIRLACEKFGADLLTKSERERIFEAIISGPSEQDFREFVGDQFTEELFEKRRHRFHRVQLTPFASVLFGKYADYFHELQAQEEKPVTDDDYPPYRMEGVRSGEERSPKPADELKKMPDEKLLLFLNEWNNVHFNSEEWWVDINFRGLAQAFESVFKEVILPDESRLHFWIDNRDRIQRPIYVQAIVSVVHEQVKSKQFDKLDLWFELCEWVLSRSDQPIGKEGSNRRDESKEHPAWESSRRAVGDFIEMCLEKDIPMSLSQPATAFCSLLDKLCTQYDRRLDDNDPVLVGQKDQLTKAINNTRGRALEKSSRSFGYWIRRQLKDDQADTPEVFAIPRKANRFGM